MRSQYYGGLADSDCGGGCQYRWENFSPTDETVYDGSDNPEIIMADCNVHCMKWSTTESKFIFVGFKPTHYQYWDSEALNGTGDWITAEFTKENIESHDEYQLEHNKDYYDRLLKETV